MSKSQDQLKLEERAYLVILCHPAADVDIDDVLEVPDLRGQLQPMKSPFCTHNNYGGGFVNEDDRVALSSIYFSSPTSTGATDMCRPATRASIDGSDMSGDVRPPSFLQ